MNFVVRAYFFIKLLQFHIFQVECYLWTSYNKKYRFGKLYLSQNFACFASHVHGLVNVVIPLRDVSHVEKADSCPNGNTIDQALRFVMRSKGKEFIFAQLEDRNFIIDKIAELLAAAKDEASSPNFRNSASSTASSSSYDKLADCVSGSGDQVVKAFEASQPLMNIYLENIDRMSEAAKAQWIILPFSCAFQAKNDHISSGNSLF